MGVTVNPNIFREYDIRGVADRDLTDEVVRSIGLAYASMIAAATTGNAGESRRPQIAVGRDCRLSGPRLSLALTEGLRSGGADVIDVGVGPTPKLYFSVHHLALDGGIMVTGSHNPPNENGFKMMQGKASFFGPDIQELKRRIEAGELGRTDGAVSQRSAGTLTSHDVDESYLNAMTRDLRMGTVPCPLVLDAGNGAGGPLGVEVLKRAGFKPETLFCDMDGTFPNHHPDPTVPKNLEALVAKVKASGARVGLAYDGDADRLGAVDEQGTMVWGDRLLILFARAVLKEKPGTAVIGEVKCSQTLYDDIAKHGGRPIMWKTGHSLIKTKMKAEGALLAGEMSGHLFFADRYFGFDDALYAGLRLLEILTHDPRSLSEMLADVPRTFSTPELRVDCPDEKKFAVVQAVLARARARGLRVSDVDGARISFGDEADVAWGLVRASNTGPILVLRFEAATEAVLTKIRADLETMVAEERAKLGAL
jgi:phosphomannomutase / phosphoglucomutase